MVHRSSDSVVVKVNKMVPMTFNTKMKAGQLHLEAFVGPEFVLNDTVFNNVSQLHFKIKITYFCNFELLWRVSAPFSVAKNK